MPRAIDHNPPARTIQKLPGCEECRGLGFVILDSDDLGAGNHRVHRCDCSPDVTDEQAAEVLDAVLVVVGESVAKVRATCARNWRLMPEELRETALCLSDTLEQAWTDVLSGVLTLDSDGVCDDCRSNGPSYCAKRGRHA